MGESTDQHRRVPESPLAGTRGRLSWNIALDLWLIAELLGLAVVVVVIATDRSGRLAGSSHVAIGIAWLVIDGLTAWYHRSVELQVVRTDRLRQALVDWVKASVITLVGAFMIGELKSVSRLWVFATFVAGVGTIVLVGAIARRIGARLARRGALGERIAIYGTSEKTEALIALIEHGASLAKVHLISDQRNRGGKTIFNGMVAGHDLDDFIRQIRQQQIDTVVIDLPWSAGSRIDHVVNALEQISVNISMAPMSLGLEGAKQSVTYVGGRPTLALYRRRITGFQALAKASLDRVAAAIALLLLAVPLLIVAAAIKLDSPGAVLFRQKRRGMNNEAFDMLKFRSMYTASTDANADRLVSKGDSRVTRVGAFLRRTSIDELPQLVNVLRGQMSLVGPRPHAYGAKADERLYEEVVKRYPARHRVLPGITGLAQVRGYRGNTEAEQDIVNRVESDIEYIDRWTPALDIQIIFRTAATFLFQTGAY